MAQAKFHVDPGIKYRISTDDSLNTDVPRLIKAFGYVRVSTKQQAGEDRLGELMQKQEIQKYAVENGYEIIDWYVDEISGVKEDRPALNEILFAGACEKKRVEAVIAYKSDRIARDIKLYFYYLYLLEKRNIKLISVKEQFDDDQYGLSSIFRTLMLFVAEQERKNIAMRTSGGRKAKAAQGGYAGGKAPYGYKAEHGRLVVDEKEAVMVQTIFKYYEAGCNYNEIASILNFNGFRTRNGKEFLEQHIRLIIKNRPTYEGYYKYGEDGKWVTGQHTPLIPKAIRKIPEIEMLNAELREIIEAGQSDSPELNENDTVTESNTMISDLPVSGNSEPEQAMQDNAEDNMGDANEKPQIGADFDVIFADDIPEPEESKPESDANPKSILDQPQKDPLATVRRGVSYGNTNRGVI